MAVAHADHILQLQEHLDRSEMPPVWMWPFAEEMNEWLDRVQAERRNPKPTQTDPEEENMQENVLLMRGRR